MGLDRARLSEIAGDAWSALRRRPRLAFLAACVAVLLASWWGTQRFADQLLSSLPLSEAPVPPTPMTEAELQRQIDEARRINDELRANREARAFAVQHASVFLADSLGMPDGTPKRPADAGATTARSSDAPDPDAFVAIDEPAEPIYTVRASLPELARQAGVEGTVVVQALVGIDGRVRDTRVIKSVPLLNGAAQAAVRQWRFKPAATGGSPVATWVSVPMAFRK
ncbi:MAG: energy transducer TonB [Candidatus Eisenbacteria bacterium]